MRFSTFSVWQFGYQPLHFATCHAAKVLLQLGADIEARNPVSSWWYLKHQWLKYLQMNWTPFLESVCCGDQKKMELLIQKGCNVNALSEVWANSSCFLSKLCGFVQDNKNALHIIAETYGMSSDDKVSIAERLLSYGVDADCLDSVES